MKKLIMFISLLTFINLVTISCNNDDDSNNTQIIEYNTIPEKSQNFITEHFPNHTIAIVEKNNISSSNGTIYEVKFSNRDEIEFDINGNWLKIEGEGKNSIPTTFILPIIIEYITINYPTSQINEINKNGYGYEIELTNNLDLIFNLDGDFIKVDS